MKTNLAIQKVKTVLALIIVGSLIGMTIAADKSHGLSKKEPDQKHTGQIEESVESPLKRKMHAYRHIRPVEPDTDTGDRRVLSARFAGRQAVDFDGDQQEGKAGCASGVRDGY